MECTYGKCSMFNLCRLLIRSRVRISDFIANIQTYIALRCRFDSKLQYVAFESLDEGSINLHFEGLGAGESHLHLGLLSGIQMIGELLHAALLTLVGALVQRAIPVALGVASAAVHLVAMAAGAHVLAPAVLLARESWRVEADSALRGRLDHAPLTQVVHTDVDESLLGASLGGAGTPAVVGSAATLGTEGVSEIEASTDVVATLEGTDRARGDEDGAKVAHVLGVLASGAASRASLTVSASDRADRRIVGVLAEISGAGGRALGGAGAAIGALAATTGRAHVPALELALVFGLLKLGMRNSVGDRRRHDISESNAEDDQKQFLHV